MPTECNLALFDFPAAEGRAVVASFDGGAITSNAGALPLGQTDRAIRLTERFAACFADTRTAGLVEHQVETLVCSVSSALRGAMRPEAREGSRIRRPSSPGVG